MCIIALKIDRDSPQPLIVLHNRDEFRERPSLPWQYQESGLYPLDLKRKGTWMGVSHTGRFAAVLNYRMPRPQEPKESRGDLPLQYLHSHANHAEYLSELQSSRCRYHPFSLVFGNLTEGYCIYESVKNRHINLKEGEIHAFTNGPIDVMWFKQNQIKKHLDAAFKKHAFLEATQAFDILNDRVKCSLEHLPQTGIPVEQEHAISSAFVNTPPYGTVSSSFLRLDEYHAMSVTQWEYDASGQVCAESELLWPTSS